MAQMRAKVRRAKPSTRLKVKRAQALLAAPPKPDNDILPSKPEVKMLLKERLDKIKAERAAREAEAFVPAIGLPVLPPSITKLPPLEHVDKGIMERKAEHKPEFSVTIMPETVVQYPHLWTDVFIHGDRWEEAQFAEMFTRAKCSRAASPMEADLMVFTGGADVNPELYGEERHTLSRYNEERDNQDIDMYLMCLEYGIPMLGICRGAQFLHVMNDGRLFQDVDNHQGAHPMWDCKNKVMLDRVSSVHHQMVRPNIAGGMEILGTVKKSTRRIIDKSAYETGEMPDIEAFYYRETNCLGIQGHPEYSGYTRFAKWVLEQVKEYLMSPGNPDMIIANNQHKLRPDILNMRPRDVGRTKHLEAYLAARAKKEK